MGGASSTVDMLRGAQGKIEKGWTQDAYARDEHGKELLPLDTNAVCWCLSGAAIAAARNGGSYPRATLAEALAFASIIDMQDWNDKPSRTQAEVLARIDQSLERAGGGDQHPPRPDGRGFSEGVNPPLVDASRGR